MFKTIMCCTITSLYLEWQSWVLQPKVVIWKHTHTIVMPIIPSCMINRKQRKYHRTCIIKRNFDSLNPFGQLMIKSSNVQEWYRSYLYEEKSHLNKNDESSTICSNGRLTFPISKWTWRFFRSFHIIGTTIEVQHDPTFKKVHKPII